MTRKFLGIGLLSLFLMFASNKVEAQSPDAEKMGVYLTQEMSFLNMTPLQAEQVNQINIQAVNALGKLDEKSIALNSTQSENINDFAKILKERSLALKEILTPSQFQNFQENKILRAAAFRTFVMAHMLDLTEDQRMPVFGINQNVVENVRKDLDTYFSAPSKNKKRSAERKLQKALKKADKDFDQILSPKQSEIYHENVEVLRKSLREEYGIND